MQAVNIEDLRRLAKRRLPAIFFDYIDGGAFGERTLAANRADFDRYRLMQKALKGVDVPDLSTDFMGARQALPFMLGPVGFLGLYAGSGDIKAARAAHRAGVPFALSTFSITSIVKLRQATEGPLHFQLYVLTDRGLTEEFVAGAESAGVEALYVTVDTAVTAVRERDVRNGFRSLTRVTPGLAMRMALKPSWLVDLLASGMPSVGALAERPDFGSGALEQAANLSRRIDRRLDWNDIAMLRERWRGRLVVKGILNAADALACQSLGVDGVILSNHGGRQLDAGNSTISMLAEIRDAVGPDFEVMIDSGFRRGTDIVKALALGASGVLLGRAYAYGLAARGQAGVTEAIEILRNEIAITLTLMGISSVDELKALGRSVLREMPASAG